MKVSDGSVVGDCQTIYSLAKIDGVVAFYLVGQDVVIPAGKVYLEIEHEQASHANCLKMSMDEQRGVTTGIRDVPLHDTADWFTINGRKLNGKPVTKGLYLKNGKKYVIN